MDDFFPDLQSLNQEQMKKKGQGKTRKVKKKVVPQKRGETFLEVVLSGDVHRLRYLTSKDKARFSQEDRLAALLAEKAGNQEMILIFQEIGLLSRDVPEERIDSVDHLIHF